MIHRTLAAIALVTGIAAVPCTPTPARAAPPVDVSVVELSHSVRPTGAVTGGDAIQLAAARNEFEAAQVVVSPRGDVLRALTAAVAAPLSGPAGATIPLTEITVSRSAVVVASNQSDNDGTTGEFHDPLIPAVDPYYGETRNAFPYDAPADRNTVVVVDVHVPAAAPAGRYAGSVVLTADGWTRTVPIELDVADAVLPSTSNLRSLFILDWTQPCKAHTGDANCSGDQAERWGLHALYTRAALEHRITLANASPQWITDDPAPAGVQRQLFEQQMLPLIDGTHTSTAGATRPPRLLGSRLTTVTALGSTFAGQACVGACLAAWRDLANADGFADRFVYYACDEPHTSSARWANCAQQFAQRDAIWPQVPNLVTTPIQRAQEYDGYGTIDIDDLDILVPTITDVHGKPGNYFPGENRSLYDAFVAQAPQKQMWVYWACDTHACGTAGGATHPLYDGWPDMMVDQPGEFSRAIGWMPVRYRATGLLYWNVAYQLASAWAPDGLWYESGNGDGTLFYPGTPARIGGTHDIPIDSLRLLRIRDGIEDADLAILARDAGRDAEVDVLAREMMPTAWDMSRFTTPGAIDSAHRQLLALAAGSGGLAAFTATGPERLADTRSGTGYTRLDACTIRVQVAGRAGVPATAVAAALTVTVDAAVSDGWAAAWPTGTEWSGVSNLNVRAGETRANSAIVQLGAGGAVDLYTSACGSAVIVDVTGSFAPAARATAGRLVPLSPARVHDATVVAGSTLTLSPEALGVPADAVAVAVNVTIDRSAAGGYATAWGAGAPQPGSSMLNTDRPGQTRAATAIVPITPAGVSIWQNIGGRLIVDVSGYLTGPGAPPGVRGLFRPQAPARVHDDRPARHGPGEWSAVPWATTGVTAVAANVTITDTAGAGYLSVASEPGPVVTSTVNASGPADSVANLAIVPTAGSLAVHTGDAAASTIIDVAGVFV